MRTELTGALDSLAEQLTVLKVLDSTVGRCKLEWLKAPMPEEVHTTLDTAP